MRAVPRTQEAYAHNFFVKEIVFLKGSAGTDRFCLARVRDHEYVENASMQHMYMSSFVSILSSLPPVNPSSFNRASCQKTSEVPKYCLVQCRPYILACLAYTPML